MNSGPLKIGEIGILQHLNRSALNGQIAEVTGELRRRMLYCLTDPAQSVIREAYVVCVPGYPAPRERIVWCVEAHQIRRIQDPDAGGGATVQIRVPEPAVP
jgi:hypothetical protein